MKYKVLKDIPGLKEGAIIDGGTERMYKDYLEKFGAFFQPIEEKKSIYDLKDGDPFWYVNNRNEILESFLITSYPLHIFGNKFLTKEHAEKEVQRRKLLAKLLKSKHDMGVGRKWEEYSWENDKENFSVIMEGGEIKVDFCFACYSDLSLGYFKTKEGVKKYAEQNKEDLLSYFALCKELN